MGRPSFFVDREPTGIDTDVIAVDNAAATAVAVRHLVNYGHRRIAHLGDRDRIQTARIRRQAFRTTLAKHAIPIEESLIVPDLGDELLAYAATRRLMESSEPPTAIHSARNLITVGVLRALRDLGTRHQVAVVGFDDIEQGDLVDPPVTVIAYDLGRIGAVAAERLMSRVEGDTPPPQKIIIPTQLIARGSGEIRPQPL